MQEVWKDIPGYEGRYQASTEGRIRSVSHRVRLVAHGKETTRLMQGRVLRPGRYCKSGHVSVVLGHGAGGSPVHRLVALTFLGPAPDGCEVCHNDGDPTNNALSNLRYDTRSENIKDVLRQGGRWRRLTREDVQEIREMLKNGCGGAEIAKRFSISQNCVSAIKTGRAFGWLNTERFQST